MVRYLMMRRPVMVAPRSILNPVSRIAIRDVLSYLLLAVRKAPQRLVEVGAAPKNFTDLMLTYARRQRLRMGRLYLPWEELQRFGLTDEDIARGLVEERWTAFMRCQTERAELVASFPMKDLLLDWRHGAAFFMGHHLGCDEAVNRGN
jgi:hypothetical protein